MPQVRYGILFTSLAAAIVSIGLAVGGARSLFIAWLGLGFGQVGLAYLLQLPLLLGKRPDGRVTRLAWMIGAMPITLNHAILLGLRVFGSEHPCDQVAPGIYVGRRPTAAELPEGVMTIVDLAAELAAAKPVRKHPGYLSFPILDNTIPTFAVLEQLVRVLLPRLELGPMLIHCAAGHGRSAAVAVAVSVARHDFATIALAERGLALARPGIALTAWQRRGLEQWLSEREKYASRINEGRSKPEGKPD